MNKVVRTAQYFITVALGDIAEVNEAIATKLEVGDTELEFQQLFNQRQELKQAIVGLGHLQWHEGMLKAVKPYNKKQALQLAKTLRKELAELAWSTDKAEKDFRQALERAWQFVIDNSMTQASSNSGLSIFDEPSTAEQTVMTVVEGSKGRPFNAEVDAPEFAPVS